MVAKISSLKIFLLKNFDDYGLLGFYRSKDFEFVQFTIFKFLNNFEKLSSGNGFEIPNMSRFYDFISSTIKDTKNYEKAISLHKFVNNNSKSEPESTFKYDKWF